MANYRLKNYFHGGCRPNIDILVFFFPNTMHSWRLEVTVALMACGLGLLWLVV